MQKLNHVIYCDMDGVLVDFIEGTGKLLGKPWESYKTKEDKLVRDKYTFELPGFWNMLDPMPDYHDLWNFIHKYDPRILTAYPHSYDGKEAAELCKIGKWQWNERYMQVPKDRFHVVLRSAKQIYATHIDQDSNLVSNILIDDTEQNIKEWNKNRGIGILHTDAASTINKLMEMGYV